MNDDDNLGMNNGAGDYGNDDFDGNDGMVDGVDMDGNDNGNMDGGDGGDPDVD